MVLFKNKVKIDGYFESEFNKGSLEYYLNKKELKIGVYLLYKGNQIVYIGKSINVINRIYNHRTNKVDFDYAMIYNFKSDQDIHYIEPYLIGLNNPKLNKDCNYSGKPSIKIKWQKCVTRKTKLTFCY